MYGAACPRCAASGRGRVNPGGRRLSLSGLHHVLQAALSILRDSAR